MDTTISFSAIVVGVFFSVALALVLFGFLAEALRVIAEKFKPDDVYKEPRSASGTGSAVQKQAAAAALAFHHHRQAGS